MKWYDVWPKPYEAPLTFKSLPKALRRAARGAHLVTERTPIGDPRFLLVEDLARETPPALGSAEDERFANYIQAAKQAIKEADNFDFYRACTRRRTFSEPSVSDEHDEQDQGKQCW